MTYPFEDNPNPHRDIRTHHKNWCDNYQPRWRRGVDKIFWCANCGLLLGLRDMDRFNETDPKPVNEGEYI